MQLSEDKIQEYTDKYYPMFIEQAERFLPEGTKNKQKKLASRMFHDAMQDVDSILEKLSDNAIMPINIRKTFPLLAIKKLMPHWDTLSKGQQSRLLWDVGINTNMPWEVQEGVVNVQHNLSGQLVVGSERVDKAWTTKRLGGALVASDEAILEYQGVQHGKGHKEQIRHDAINVDIVV